MVQTSINKELENSAFMLACRGKPAPYTPVWLMRQAGRFMPEYRDIRSKVSFLELCKNSNLASEVTVMAVEMLKVDAAIIFADILLPLEPLGAGLEFVKGDGPVLNNPVTKASDVDKLKQFDVVDALSFVLEAIRQTRADLPANVPLIGFAGAPFTLASYLIEGGSSRNFEKTKAFMYSQPEAWSKLLELLSKITVQYLNAQVKAGAQALQLFDSWVGCLSQADYKNYVLPHSKYIFDEVASANKTTPTIHFGTGTAHLLKLLEQAGGNVIGLDWRVALDDGWKEVGFHKAVQGNLDPCALFADKQFLHAGVKEILSQAGGRSGHIFNLGHGILPTTPVDNVKYLVDTVHELGRVN